jgi:hypothetical protein
VAEFDSVIPAGGSGKLVAKVHTKPTQNGRVNKVVSVRTDAPGAENLRLSLSFVAQAPIIIRPGARLYVNAVEGSGKTGRILLHRTDGKPLEVLKVESQGAVKIEAQAAQDGDPQGAVAGDVWLQAEILPTDPVRREDTVVAVHTNHPDRPVVEVPVTTWVRGLIEPRPDRVSLWVNQSTHAGRSTTIRITHNGGKPFEVQAVESLRPEIIRVVPMTTDARTAHTVRVELAPDVDLASLQLPLSTTIRISSSEERRPVVEVPVTVSNRSDRFRPARPRPQRPPAPAAQPRKQGK